MHRRTFMGHSAAWLGAGTIAASCRRGASADQSRLEAPADAMAATEPVAAEQAIAEPASGRWSRVKQEFALEPETIHMSGFVLASHPRRVRAAIDVYRQEIDRDPVAAVAHHRDREPADVRVREAAARYLGIQADAVALTDSTTMSLGLLYSGLVLEPGDEVLAATSQHLVTEESLRVAVAHHGAALRRFDLVANPQEASVDECVANVRAAIGDRTRVLALTWVDSLTGLRLPTRQIADVVDEINRTRDPSAHVLFCLDGAHGLGVEASSFDEIGCHFLAAGCHKWLFGPRGTGVLVGRREYWSRVRSTIASCAGVPSSARPVSPAGSMSFGMRMTPGGYHSFEHRWALDEAFAFHLELGPAAIRSRIYELSSRLMAGLAPLAHIKLASPLSDELASGLVAFNVDGIADDEVVHRLARKKITATVSPSVRTHVRLAPSLLTLEHEVDATIRAVAELRA